MVFDPTGVPLESLIGNRDALRVPISIEIGRHRPLTTRMWEKLFREMEQAGLNTDMRLYERAEARTFAPGPEGFNYIRRHTDRFVITSISRGSIIIDGVVILAVGAWFIKQFISPGWEKSASKKDWDEGVAGTIDKVIPFLKDQIDYHIVHRLKRHKITRVSLQPPPNPLREGLLDNSTSSTVKAELIYDKPRQIEHHPKKASPY